MKKLILTILPLLILIFTYFPLYSTEVNIDNVVILLDASGSMTNLIKENDKSTGIKTRMEAAKDALKEVIKHIPKSTHIGLLVFGASNLKNDWAYPLGPRDNIKLRRAIDLPKPLGATPLGEYMKKAADRLLLERKKQMGYGTYKLLIVTDGEASDRDLVIKYTPEIISRGITVDVIGVDMSSTHTLATMVHSYKNAIDEESLKKAVKDSFAEISATNSNDISSDFDELSGIPDELALASIKALSSSGNEPIGETVSNKINNITSKSLPVPPKNNKNNYDKFTPNEWLFLILVTFVLLGKISKKKK